MTSSPSLLDLAGLLSDEGAAEFEAAIDAADAAYDDDLADVVEELERSR